MLVIFSPFTFLFTLVYLLTMALLPSVTDFFIFWLLIEVLMLVFIGIAYTVLTNSLSQLIVYFFVQSISSFFILIAFVCSSSLLITLSLIAKMGMAPFFMWYLFSVVRFPNFLLFFASTIHNLPVLGLLLQFSNPPLNPFMLWSSIILSALVSGLSMLSSQDVRYLLVSSSVGNNSWFILAMLSGLQSLILFVSLYVLFFLLATSVLNSSYRLRSAHTPSRTLTLALSLCLLSALPPSPLFLAKICILFNLFSLEWACNFFPLVIFLLVSSLMVSGYVVFCMSFLVQRYSSSLSQSLSS